MYINIKNDNFKRYCVMTPPPPQPILTTPPPPYHTNYTWTTLQVNTPTLLVMILCHTNYPFAQHQHLTRKAHTHSKPATNHTSCLLHFKLWLSTESYHSGVPTKWGLSIFVVLYGLVKSRAGHFVT
jgi:hypothetical protein